MRRHTRHRPALRWVGCVLAPAIALSGACREPPSDASSSDVIVLLGGNPLNGSTRAAIRLQELAEMSGVLGERANVVALGAPEETTGDLGARLGALSEARAVIAVLGDISELMSVDPNESIRVERRLSERTWDPEQLLEDIKGLRTRCSNLGAPLVLATAPLGRRARVEVPELLALQAWLARHFDRTGTGLQFLDLSGAFEAKRGHDLFEDGVTRLDEVGHELLAETLHELIASRQTLVPARSEMEQLARRDARVLHKWASGQDAELEITAKGLRHPGLTQRASTFRVSAFMAVHGQSRSVKDRFIEVESMEHGESLPPGLALGRRFADEWTPDSAPRDPLERDIIPLLDVLGTREEGAWDDALALTRRYPYRLSAWITLEFARQRLQRDLNTALLAVQARALFDSPISDERFAKILADWRQSTRLIPLLLIAEASQVGATPRGEVLETARRRDRLGMTGHAAAYLSNRSERDSLPAEWLAEIERLQAKDRALAGR